MNAKVLKITEKYNSKTDGIFYVIVLELEDGKTAITYLVPKDKQGKPYRNYTRWQPLLEVGKKVTGLKWKEQGLIDADSPVEEWKTEEQKAYSDYKDFIA